MGYCWSTSSFPTRPSLERTQNVIEQIEEIAHDPGSTRPWVIAGQSLLLNAYGSNFGTMFLTLTAIRRADDAGHSITRPSPTSCGARFPARDHRRQDHDLRPAAGARRGRAGGYMIMIEDRGDLGPQALQEQTEAIVDTGQSAMPELKGNTSVFRANVPQVFLDVDRTACMLKGVDLQDAFQTLQVYLGSLYVNDFNLFGRTWQVIVQSEAKYRDQKDDINRLRVRNASGTMVPAGGGGPGRRDQRPAGPDPVQHVSGGLDQRQRQRRASARARRSS